MAVYGFKDRGVAERLRQRATRPERIDRGDPAGLPPNVQFRSPDPGGIDAFTGAAGDPAVSTLPSAMCQAYLLRADSNGDVHREPMLDTDGNHTEFRVANGVNAEIPPGVWMGASLCAGGVYLVDWMDCEDVG